jgi:amino-acid N-acetyltransferase
MRIEAARRADLAGIRWLLEYEQLPASDLDESVLDTFLVCRDDKGVVAVVGLEMYGSVALLRSLVVDSQLRGKGLGVQLTEAAEALAKQSGVASIYLLTITAEHFFAKRGYRKVSRTEAPVQIQRSSQFSRLCPSTAVLMVKP